MAYYFNLPKLVELTKEQRIALDEYKPLNLSGDPGTGKTVVSLWKHIRNYSTKSKKSLLLVYTKTLEFYLKATALTENQEASENVKRIYWWITHEANNNYDEIIVDEAQDVKFEKYKILKNFSKNISYSADTNQSVYLSKLEADELLKNLTKLFPDNEPIRFYKNFRNSKEILLFVKSAFPEKLIVQNTIKTATVGSKPVVKIVKNESGFVNNVVEIIIDIVNTFNGEKHNVGILFPFSNDVITYYNLLSSKNIPCSRFIAGMNNFDKLERIHITTFKSSKGLEFDTVILPEFNNYPRIINTERYNTSENDYYVALTRAKINLFLLCKYDLKIDKNMYIKE